jgi:hypothetical protein
MLQSRLSGETRDFSLPHSVRTGSGAHPTSYPEVKRAGREADHSLSSSDEVRNARSYTATPLYVFMVRSLVKHGDKFISFVRVEEAFVMLKICFLSWDTRPVCWQRTSHATRSQYVTVQSKERKFNVTVNPR